HGFFRVLTRSVACYFACRHLRAHEACCAPLDQLECAEGCDNMALRERRVLFDEGVSKAMWATKSKISAAFLVATAAVTGGFLLAAAPPAAKPNNSDAVAGAKSKRADS